MAKSIMVQGTASNAGKSLVAAGLCRVFHQDGNRVVPFKSQNMALNSFITEEGLEMGRAQVMQAEAAGIAPSALMNPILLKPTGEMGSQVIVNGTPIGNMDAYRYYEFKHTLRGEVRAAYDKLAAGADIMVIEGAGSPAEINLNRDDFVNMGMAEMTGAPVLLVGDIDRGGVFASLCGTLSLLEPAARARVKGLVINKFRGDVEILKPGLAKLEKLSGVPVVGVIPHIPIELDDEDSLSEALAADGGGRPVDVAVVRLPRISNFTDMNALSDQPALGVRYVDRAERMGRPDLIILPGSKNTMADLAWLRESGLARAIHALAGQGTPVLGICGGYQMLGRALHDPHNTEHGGTAQGLGLLDTQTTFEEEKTRTRVRGEAKSLSGFFGCLSGCRFEGYEIHMGRTETGVAGQAFATLTEDGAQKEDGNVAGNVMGCYVHGLFDSGEIPHRLAQALLERKGLDGAVCQTVDHAKRKEAEYDKLADAVRGALDMRQIYDMMD